jgi:hypothetical protein
MTMTIDKPGIYTDFPIGDYFADPCPVPSLTQSIAKLIVEQSPAHAKQAHPRLTPMQDDGEEKYNRAMVVGDVVHKLILGRGKDVEICRYENWKTKAARDFRDDVQEGGRIAILEKDAERAKEVAAVALIFLKGHEVGALPEIATRIDVFARCQALLLNGSESPAIVGDSELVLAWQEESGWRLQPRELTWFRSLVDLSSNDFTRIWDIKTTARALPPHEVGRKMSDDGWDIQAAMIERGLNVLHPETAGRRKFFFVSIEQFPPYGVLVNELAESVLTIGRSKLAYAVERWQESMATGVWPAYAPVIHCPEYPPYAEAKWFDREQTHHEEKHQ